MKLGDLLLWQPLLSLKLKLKQNLKTKNNTAIEFDSSSPATTPMHKIKEPVLPPTFAPDSSFGYGEEEMTVQFSSQADFLSP